MVIVAIIVWYNCTLFVGQHDDLHVLIVSFSFYPVGNMSLSNCLFALVVWIVSLECMMIVSTGLTCDY